jgi:superfamily II DNA or RNA helicase
VARDGVRVIVGTAQLVGEGWDFPDVSSCFLATPIKFRGRVIQVIGRVLRPAPGKEVARIFDYVDNEVNVLRYSAIARRRTYRQEFRMPDHRIKQTEQLDLI